jgi:hypothetical protein
VMLSEVLEGQGGSPCGVKYQYPEKMAQLGKSPSEEALVMTKLC